MFFFLNLDRNKAIPELACQTAKFIVFIDFNVAYIPYNFLVRFWTLDHEMVFSIIKSKNSKIVIFGADGTSNRRVFNLLNMSKNILTIFC